MNLRQRTRQRLGKMRHAYRGRGLPRVHFLHVGKTGGTAVKGALKPYATTGPNRLDLHGHDFTLAQVPRGDRFFFVTRDPITRFVSGFYSRKFRGAPPSRSPWTSREAEAFREFATPNDLAEQLETNDRARRAMGEIIHVRSHYATWFGSPDQFLARTDDLVQILQTERLDDDFAALVPRLGLEHVVLPADADRAHRGRRDVDRSVSDLAVANLRAWYADDYAFLVLCDQITAGR